MNYSALTDQELQRLAAEGDDDAASELVFRYRRIVKICIRPYFLAGGDSEDLLQEGMIGLLHAIREFDPEAGASFKTFAELCIKRRVISAAKSASRLKHAPLNDGISLEEILSEEAQLDSALIGQTFARSPEDQILARERECDFISTFSRYLSDFERKILSDYLHGLSYAEIAERRSRSPKSVDNAVQRIRKKLARHLHSGDFSDLS